jgi:hypothetical protein
MMPQERHAALFAARGLDTESLVVAMAISSHLADDDEAECWPSVARLCSLTRLSERTVQDVIAWASAPEVGWLWVSQEPGKMRRMRIDWARVADPELPARSRGAGKTRAAPTPAPGAPPQAEHPREGRTGAPGARAQGARERGAPGAPKPTSEPTTERERSHAHAPIDQIVKPPSPNVKPPDPSPSTDGPPDRLPDGRVLPRSLPELLGGRLDLVRKLYELERVETPRQLLAVPADQIQFLRGIGARNAAVLAGLVADRGFTLGELAPRPPPLTETDPGRPRRKRKGDPTAGWSDAELDAWGASGYPVDDAGHPRRPGYPVAPAGNLARLAEVSP